MSDRDNELHRLAGDLLRYGTISNVDKAAGLVRVAVGEIETGFIPWIAAAAGGVKIWRAPTVGEQVLLICPEADIEAAVALPGIFSTAMPAPANDDSLLADFPDGARIFYDFENHALKALLPAAATAEIDAKGGVTITATNGGVAITGDVTVTGKITATADITTSADVKAGAISLKNHKHSGVQAGSAKTGAPE